MKILNFVVSHQIAIKMRLEQLLKSKMNCLNYSETFWLVGLRRGSLSQDRVRKKLAKLGARVSSSVHEIQRNCCITNYLLRDIPTNWICRVGDCCVTNQVRNPIKTFWDFLGFSKICRDCAEFSRIFWDCLGVLLKQKVGFSWISIEVEDFF